MTKKKSEQRRWRICVGIIGALSMAGAMTLLFTPMVSAQDAAVGEHQFHTVCNRCHGQGEDPGPDALTKHAPYTKVAMEKIIREGTKHMKAIPLNRLSDPHMEDLIAYLRTQHTVAP